jgi:hypothetical protein
LPDAVWAPDLDSLDIAYAVVEGGWHGIGCIDLDPLFRDPESGDYHLSSTQWKGAADSPAIDAGNPAMTDAKLDCDWGLGTAAADMGAYGGRGRTHSTSDSRR